MIRITTDFDVTDAEVHHSDPTKSSGSSTSARDSALRSCISG